MKVIAQGAEAVIYLDGKEIIKERISKGYRIKFIDDRLIKHRTRREGRILERLKDVISVPKVINVSERYGKIIMEFINGDKLSDHLDNYSKVKMIKIANEIGKSVAKMHDSNVVHGDLTTSNMIFKNKVYFIDFGLSFVDEKIEHKAVDLHLIKQAMESKHYRYYEELFETLIESYCKASKNGSRVVERLDKVESRGRYKKKK
jgi:Kae1-associated kinase Bud32